MCAIVRINEKTGWISVLCPMGHYIAAHNGVGGAPRKPL